MKRYNDKNPLLTLLYSALMSIGIVIIMALAAAVFAYFISDPSEMTPLLSLISLLFSGVLGGVLSVKLFGNTPLLAFIASAVSLIPMIIAGLIIAGGMIGANVFLNYLAYLGVTALSAVISTRLRGKKKYY